MICTPGICTAEGISCAAWEANEGPEEEQGRLGRGGCRGLQKQQ